MTELPDHLDLACRFCAREAPHFTAAEHREWSTVPAPAGYWCLDSHRVVRCMVCGEVSFLRVIATSTDPQPRFLRHPDPTPRLPKHFDPPLPDALYCLYYQVVQACTAYMPTLAFMGLRRLAQLMLEHFGSLLSDREEDLEHVLFFLDETDWLLSPEELEERLQAFERTLETTQIKM